MAKVRTFPSKSNCNLILAGPWQANYEPDKGWARIHTRYYEDLPEHLKTLEYGIGVIYGTPNDPHIQLVRKLPELLEIIQRLEQDPTIRDRVHEHFLRIDRETLFIIQSKTLYQPEPGDYP